MPTPGVLSFAVPAAGFLILALLLAIGRGTGRSDGLALLVACLATAIWGAALALAGSSAPLPAGALPLVETARFVTWLVLINRLVGLLAVRSAPRRSPGGTMRARAWLLVVLALGLCYDLLLFATWPMADEVRGAWEARGLLSLLALPMAAIAARRDPQLAPGFFISRHMLLFAVGVVLVVAYAMLAGLAWNWLVRHGGPWADALGLLFATGAGLGLVLLLGSAELRQRARVFVAKHFYRTRYDYRHEWLRFIQTLSAAQVIGEPRGNAIRAIAQIIASPGGVLFLRRESPAGFVAAGTWPLQHVDLRSLPSIAVDAPLVEFLEQRQWVVDVQELRQSPALYGGMVLPAMFDAPAPYRIILPLLHGVRLIGFIVLDDPPTPFQPNFEDRDLLKTVGRHVATYIEQHETDQRLAESRQFEAYHRLTAFVMHDLKNLAAQLSLLVANAERHRRNPQFVDDAITTVANSTQRMQRLIAQLQVREVLRPRRAVSLGEAVARAVERCRLRNPAPSVDIDPADPVVEADPDQLIAGLEHVIRNAQDATPPGGTVVVSVRGDGTDGLVSVTDSGCGMTEQFIQERLFKPFDTTKGSQGLGIGAYQLREYVHSLGGTVEVMSSPGRGTVFAVRLRRVNA